MTTPQDKTILVVDDEEDIREFLAEVLEDAGFQVMTAVDGQDALGKVRESPPDFISLDLVMPRMSGIRFLHELRQRPEWSQIPVMLVTAHAGDDVAQGAVRALVAGTDQVPPCGYLEKPVQPDTYVRRVCKGVGVETLEITSDQQREEER